MPRAVSKKPVGLPTRGKTASNRLRRVDNFMLLYKPSLFTRTDGRFARSLFVDLGYGFDPRTTLESAARFRGVNPRLPILGVEIDPQRVEAAQPFADEITHFRLGGFNLPLQPGESVRLIRAFNVLRQYEEKDFPPAYERLAQHVVPGGLMIEGTSNPHGSIWVANLVRKILESGSLLPKTGDWRIGDWMFDALIFSTNFRMGFDITDFQAVLPKNYIHHVLPGERIFDFLEAWKKSAAETSAAKVFGLRQWFMASAQRLAQQGYDVAAGRKWLAKGYLIWKLGSELSHRDL
ncbi:MAG: class I SAM-dependent methyltransferase [Chloroflexota bacterium]